MTAEVYHVSKVPLEPNCVLDPRFIKAEFKYQFEAVDSAIGEPPEMRAAILKSMLLSDIIQNRGESILTFPVKETILERVRANEFPERLSRYKAIFTSPTKQDAERFRELVKGSDDRPHLHRCIIDGKFFTGDLQYVSSPNPFAPMLKQIEYVIERARFYWDGKHDESPILECLAEPGTVTVVAAADW